MNFGMETMGKLFFKQRSPHKPCVPPAGFQPTWPLDRWPRSSPWLIILIGVFIAPIFTYEPWVFIIVAGACFISGFFGAN